MAAPRSERFAAAARPVRERPEGPGPSRCVSRQAVVCAVSPERHLWLAGFGSPSVLLCIGELCVSKRCASRDVSLRYCASCYGQRV